jgi:hypothetical protein
MHCKRISTYVPPMAYEQNIQCGGYKYSIRCRGEHRDSGTKYAYLLIESRWPIFQALGQGEPCVYIQHPR